jgi:hypothetical protein
MNYYESDDYCGCTLGDISFYYGYEVEEDEEWCFTATKNNKEIVRYKCTEITSRRSMFDMTENLIAGISKMFKDGLIEIRVLKDNNDKY